MKKPTKETKDFVDALKDLNKKGAFASQNLDDLASEFSDVDKSVVETAKNIQANNGDIADLDKAMQSAANSTSAFTATLTTVAANIAIMALINVGIKIVSHAWDELNLTVDEQRQKVDELQTSYENLSSEFNTLSAKQDLTDSEKQRVDYLEKRLKLDQQILEAETRQLYKEELGVGNWFDQLLSFFDTESQSNILTNEFGGIFTGLVNYKDTYQYTLKESQKAIDSMRKIMDEQEQMSIQSPLENTTPGSLEYVYWSETLDALSSDAQKAKQELETVYDSLIMTEGDYLTQIEAAQARIDSGLLSGADLEAARKNLRTWQNAYNNIHAQTIEAEKLLGIYSDFSELETKDFFDKEAITALANSGQTLEVITDTLKTDYPEVTKYLDEQGISVGNLINYYKELNDAQASDIPTTWTISDAQSKAMYIYTAKLSTLGRMLEQVSSGTMTNSELMGYLEEFPELANETDNLTGAIQKLILAEKSSALALMSDAPDSYKEVIQGAADEALHFAGDINTLQLEILNLDDKLKRVQSGESFSEGEIAALIHQYDELSGAVVELADGGYSLEEEALSNLLNTAITASNEAISVQITQTENIINSVNQRISAYAAEAEALIALNKISKKDGDIGIGNLYSSYIGLTTDEILRTSQGRSDLIAEFGEEAVLAYERWKDNNTILDEAQAKLAELKKCFHNNVQTGKKDSDDAAEETADTAEEVSETIKSYMDAYMTYMKASLDANKIDYQTYSSDVEKSLKDMFDQGKLSAQDYFSYTRQMLEVQQDIHDSVISAVTHRIDEEIEAYEKQMDSVEERYNSEIEYLDTIKAYYEEQKSALQEANEEMDRQIALEQALYNFEQASSQRTQKVYTASSGFIYKADEDAIRDASDELRQAKLDIEIANIDAAIEQVEEQQESLEEAMNTEKEQLQEIIDKLQAYSDQWSEVAEQYEIQQNELYTQQLLGADWEKQILDGRLDTLNTFKDSYIAIQEAIANAALQSANAQLEATNSISSVSSDSSSKSVPTDDTKTGESDTPAYPHVSVYCVLDENGNIFASDFSSVEAARDFINTQQEITDDERRKLRIVKKYHDGLNAGYVGDNSVSLSSDKRLDILQKAGNGELLSTDVPSILQIGELVMTKEQQANIINSLMQNPIIPNIKLPDYSHWDNLIPTPQFNTTPVVQNINLTLPNVTNDSGYERIRKELRQMQIDALQLAHKR